MFCVVCQEDHDINRRSSNPSDNIVVGFCSWGCGKYKTVLCRNALRGCWCCPVCGRGGGGRNTPFQGSRPSSNVEEEDEQYAFEISAQPESPIDIFDEMSSEEEE